MGTNFYLAEKPPCEACGRHYEERHIGKSSAGWCFSLHVYQEDGINNLDDWKKLIVAGANIRDEYGDKVTPDEMLSRITHRSGGGFEKTPYMYNSWSEFHTRNHSEQGPAGLIRHRVDGRHCIGQGEGTYDYIVGDFS